MRISELAQRAGTSARMLRYYEQQGLLPDQRDTRGYRAYGDDALRLVREIVALQRIGFTLAEVRPFVECLRAGYDAGDACPASLSVYRRKLSDLDACIARLTAAREQVRSQLAAALARMRRVPRRRSASSPTVRGNEGSMSESARTVTDDTFAAEVLGSDRPVLVDFWATWCPPCKRLAPVVDQLAAEYAGRADVVTVNTDENPRTARDFGVLATPTLALFSGGELIRTVVGAQPKRILARMLDEAS